jgi:hypothetical protein
MEIAKVCELVNQELAGELLREDELMLYLDKTIDAINAQLNSNYPTFTEYTQELFPDYPNYNVFPEKYIRSVVIPGAAYEFYKVDEEGNKTASLFLQEYQQGLFYMTRDMMESVPPRFRGRCQGYVGMESDSLDFEMKTLW